MAVSDARRFLDEFKPDSKLGEAVKAVPREAGETSMAFYARAAASFGFDFDAAELEAAYAELQDDDRANMEAVELSDDELDQMSVAGGWCWFDNLCSKAINFMKHNPNCEYSYNENEECKAIDRCDFLSNYYYCTSGPEKEVKW